MTARDGGRDVRGRERRAGEIAAEAQRDLALDHQVDVVGEPDLRRR
ncbi:MAG TPA: hypothetical protein VLX44_07170 [Xanthobacteraceae bacterium]|nr:hypothetical protein [Xanthobacteraceae bacterium]